MMDDDVIEVPVLVIGAGPAGLTAAVTLARSGVECLVVERRRHGSTEPRATGVSTGSMELLRRWGLERQVRELAEDVEWTGWTCRTLADAAAGSAWPTGLPTRSQAAIVSPSAPACVAQDELEPLLLEHLRGLGPARVELGIELVRLEQEADGVHAVLRDAATGAERRARAAYVVAADGVRSGVRAALGIAMEGQESVGQRVGALFRAPVWSIVGPHRHVIYVVDQPEAAGAVIPAGRGDRWIHAMPWDPERERLADYPPERMAGLVRLAVGAPALQPRIERISAVTYGAQLAERFREDRVFLVGDAAHRISPRGATGMNTAIRDGFDLGWKLAWVLHGWAGTALLDSYEAERRPVAAHNVMRSASPTGSLREADEELHVDLGGRIRHVWVDGPVGRRSTLDLIGPGLTVFAGDHCPVLGPVIRHLPAALPRQVRRLDPMAARRLGVPLGGALVVRPDGVPVAAWPGAATGLADPAAATAGELPDAVGLGWGEHGLAAARRSPAPA